MEEGARSGLPAFSAVDRKCAPHFVELADSLLEHEHVAVARGVLAAFDLRVWRDRIRTLIALRSVVERHRHLLLRARHDVEWNSVIGIVPEIGMQISGERGDVFAG